MDEEKGRKGWMDKMEEGFYRKDDEKKDDGRWRGAETESAVVPLSRVDRAALRFDVRPGSTYAPCANRVIMYSRSAPWPVVGVKRGGPRGVRTVTDVNYPSCVCVGGRKEARVVLSTRVASPSRESPLLSLSLSTRSNQSRGLRARIPFNFRRTLEFFFFLPSFDSKIFPNRGHRLLKFRRVFQLFFSSEI